MALTDDERAVADEIADRLMELLPPASLPRKVRWRLYGVFSWRYRWDRFLGWVLTKLD
jgi:hypothetical protein